MRRHFFSLFSALTALAWCAELRGVEPEASPSEWKLISNKGGVALYRRDRPITNESKAIGEIAAAPSVVHAVINDVESYASFMPYTVECRVLKREGNSIVAYQRISAPLTSDRDYTVRMRSSSKPVEGGTSYLSQWKADNSLGPPEKSGVVRVNLCDGSWRLEPIGPNTTRATYTIYTDSGGAIPAFIKNTGSQVGIRRLFAAIRKQARDPKYADEKAEGGRRRAEGGREKVRLNGTSAANFDVLGDRDEDSDQFVSFAAKRLDQRRLYHT